MLTLLTLFLLPVIIVWVFRRHVSPADGDRESAFVRAYRSALLGTIIGTTAGPKAAIAITQVAMFVLAFGGGLFLPPLLFPEWLDLASKFLWVREAREIVIAAALGTGAPLWAVLGILLWTLVLGVLAVWLYRRDEGRRYR